MKPKDVLNKRNLFLFLGVFIFFIINTFTFWYDNGSGASYEFNQIVVFSLIFAAGIVFLVNFLLFIISVLTDR